MTCPAAPQTKFLATDVLVFERLQRYLQTLNLFLELHDLLRKILSNHKACKKLANQISVNLRDIRTSFWELLRRRSTPAV